MQLPRGTFRSIKKEQNVSDLLQELETLQFSGSCTLSWGKGTSILVLNKGRVMLAEHQVFRGDDALNEIRAFMQHSLTVELSDLNPVQLNLAEEFNKQYIIQDSKRSSVTFGKAVVPAPVVADMLPQPAKPVRTVPEKSSRSPDRECRENDWLDDIKESDFNGVVKRDFASLERMDLESMTEKIRKTCKSTVQRLDLGHLMEGKSGK
ncbi:MAG: hypothetical protein LUQ40_03240 [Methanomicrobiales archaeon]|nr:hypothetical protein [Methanomicrobiales archaeon]